MACPLLVPWFVDLTTRRPVLRCAKLVGWALEGLQGCHKPWATGGRGEHSSFRFSAVFPPTGVKWMGFVTPSWDGTWIDSDSSAIGSLTAHCLTRRCLPASSSGSSTGLSTGPVAAHDLLCGVAPHARAPLHSTSPVPSPVVAIFIFAHTVALLIPPPFCAAPILHPNPYTSTRLAP